MRLPLLLTVVMAGVAAAPITLTLDPGATGNDTEIAAGGATNNYGALTNTAVGERNDQVGAIFRTLIKFDLSSIPDTAYFSSVKLRLVILSARSDNAATWGVYRLKREWVEGTRTGQADSPATGATWNRYDTTNNWQTAGGFGADDCEQAAIGTASVAAAAGDGTLVEITLTGARKTDIDLGNGWLIKTADELNDYHTIYSFENATAANTPKLELTYTLVPFDDVAVSEPVDAAWSFFGQPHAIYDAAANKTYLGFATSDGYVRSVEYKHATGSYTNLLNLHQFTADDHNQPQFLVRADGKIMAFYCAHNGANLYQRVSIYKNSLLDWYNETDLDVQLEGSAYSYPSPIQLTGEENSPIYLFYRAQTGAGIYRDTYYSKSIDSGATWTAKQALFDVTNQRPYFQLAQNGNARIDFIETDGHPNEVATNSLYHFYYEGGNYYKSDGTLIGDVTVLPLTPAGVTKIYDGTTVNCWGWDIAINGSGNPVVVFATFPTPASDHRYNYAVWTGSAWDIHEICQAGAPLYAGEAYYSGGVYLDHADPSIVYCSRQVSGQWEIFQYVTADGGASWTPTQITTGSANPNIRPVVPYGAASGFPLVWLNGVYTSYTDFLMNLTKE